jgi:hypothetical protein
MSDDRLAEAQSLCSEGAASHLSADPYCSGCERIADALRERDKRIEELEKKSDASKCCGCGKAIVDGNCGDCVSDAINGVHERAEAAESESAKLRAELEAAKKERDEVRCYACSKNVPIARIQCLECWKATELKANRLEAELTAAREAIGVAVTRGEFLGIAKLAEKAWCMKPEQTATLVMDMSGRALSWLKVNAPEDYAALSKLSEMSKKEDGNG